MQRAYYLEQLESFFFSISQNFHALATFVIMGSEIKDNQLKHLAY